MTEKLKLRKLLKDFSKEVQEIVTNPFSSSLKEVETVDSIIDKYVERYFQPHIPKNNLEKEEILSPSLVSTIDVIISKYPTVVFGGSVVLNALGIIERPIKDLDLFVKCGDYHIVADIFSRIVNVTRIPSETVTDVNGVEIERFGWNINGSDVCLFLIPEIKKESLYSAPFEFLGRTIQLQNVNEAILAKKSYAKMDKPSCEKHREDVKKIDSFFKDLY